MRATYKCALIVICKWVQRYSIISMTHYLSIPLFLSFFWNSSSAKNLSQSGKKDGPWVHVWNGCQVAGVKLAKAKGLLGAMRKWKRRVIILQNAQTTNFMYKERLTSFLKLETKRIPWNWVQENPTGWRWAREDLLGGAGVVENTAGCVGVEDIGKLNRCSRRMQQNWLCHVWDRLQELTVAPVYQFRTSTTFLSQGPGRQRIVPQPRVGVGQPWPERAGGPWWLVHGPR